ncbi:MAG TPA: L-lactate dehydrogenase [Chloroflexia bacterium]|nr:L-lactate dehydrogenase [Chloroflexia bacterium]
MTKESSRRPGAGGNTVAIIGAGQVGSACAFSLAHSGVASDIILIDVAKDRAEGEAMDISHGVAFLPPTTVRTADYSACAEADVVVITAGTARKPGETRMDLLQRNAGIMRGVLEGIKDHRADAVIVMVANPVDVMAYAAHKLSDFPPPQIIATGTLLETARLRYMVGEHCGVAPNSVEGYTLAEHGETQVTPWSQVRVAGLPVAAYCQGAGIAWGPEVEATIAGRVKKGGADVIARKNATFYGIAVCTMTLVKAILRDEHAVLPVSTLVNGAYGMQDVYISLPTVIGRAGVIRTLTPELTAAEQEALGKSAQALRTAIGEAGF